MKNLSSVSIVWAQRQRLVKVNFPFIRELVQEALPLCLEQPRHSSSTLPAVIEISLLSDRAITKVHADFLDDPTPTDVITFAHSLQLGEILIGMSTAAAHAKKFHQSIDHEVARYAIHGLLHLLDYDDTTAEEYNLMHARQESILKQVLKNYE